MLDVAWGLVLAFAVYIGWQAEPLLLAPEPGWLGLRRRQLVHDGLSDHNTDPDTWVNALRQTRGLVPGSVAARPTRGKGAHRAPRRPDPAPPRRPPPPDPHFVPSQDADAQRRKIEEWAGRELARPVETIWLTSGDPPPVPIPLRPALPPELGWDVRYDGPVTRGPDHEPEPGPALPADDPPTVIRGLRAVMDREMPPLPGYPED